MDQMNNNNINNVNEINPFPIEQTTNNIEAVEINQNLPTTSSRKKKKRYNLNPELIKQKEKQVYSILEHQLDLELYMKKKELAVIENELDLAKQVENLLGNWLKAEASLGDNKDSTDLKELNTQLQNSNKRQKGFIESNSFKNKMKTNFLYVKKEDGTFVKLICTECGRSNFGSNQGFINHCRISHNIDFPTHQEAAIACGIEVPESEVPLDHKCRRTHIKPVVNPLKSKIAFGCGSTLYKQFQRLNKELLDDKPKIKVYEEDVNLEDNLSDHSNTNSLASSLKERLTNKNEDIQLKPSGKKLARQPLNSNLKVEKEEGNYEKEERNCEKEEGSYKKEEKEFEVTEISKENQEDQYYLKEKKVEKEVKVEKIIKEDEIQNLEEKVETIKQVNNIKKEEIKSNRVELLKIQSTPWTDTSLQNRLIDQQNLEKERVTNNCKDGQDTSLSAQLGLDYTSRFYIKKRIIVGNVSKYLPPENRKEESSYFKWMIYISGPSYDPDLSGFISKVRFYLHPSYKPNDIIEVLNPPFHLTNYGWGEFPIRIQLHFHDTKNKPMDFIHQLKLDHQLTGVQQLGDERMLDIELDRNTKFLSKLEIGKNKPHSINQQNEIQWIPADFGINKTIHQMLLHLLKDHPIICKKQDMELPYTIAPNSNVYYHEWTEGRRKSSEYLRSYYLYENLKKENIILENEENNILIQQLTIKQLINWCKIYDLKLENKGSISLIPIKDRLANQGYCKCCGIYGKVNLNYFCLFCLKVNELQVNSLSNCNCLLNQLPKGWDQLFQVKNNEIENEDEDEEDLIIIDDEPSEMEINSGNQRVIQLWKEKNREEKLQVPSFVSDNEMKFIIEQVKLLKLSTFNKFNLNPKIVPSMLAIATRLFLIKLLNHTLNVCDQQTDTKNNLVIDLDQVMRLNLNDSNNNNNLINNNLIKNQPRLLTPIHIWKALMSLNNNNSLNNSNNNNFDFLLNCFMGHEK